MNQMIAPAQEAKIMLGPCGMIDRVSALATVFCVRSQWIVAAPDSHGEGGIYVTAFSGPQAHERAMEYASEKYSGVQVLGLDQRPTNTPLH